MCERRDSTFTRLHLVHARVDTRLGRFVDRRLMHVANEANDRYLRLRRADLTGPPDSVRRRISSRRPDSPRTPSGVPLRSCCDRSRPAISGIPIALKKPSLVNIERRRGHLAVRAAVSHPAGRNGTRLSVAVKWQIANGAGSHRRRAPCAPCRVSRDRRLDQRPGAGAAARRDRDSSRRAGFPAKTRDRPA